MSMARTCNFLHTHNDLRAFWGLGRPSLERDHLPISHLACKAKGSREGEPADKPGSVVNSHSSGTRVTTCLKRPTRKHARARAAAPVKELRLPYLALLQVGFAMPYGVTTDAVRSYRTLSPLPALLPALRRFTFCCTFRGLTPPRRYLAPCPPSPDFPPHSAIPVKGLPHAATVWPALQPRTIRACRQRLKPNCAYFILFSA